VASNVAAALDKALEKLPADRFESARAFEEALKNPHYRPEGGAASVGMRAGYSRRRWPLFAGVAGGLLAGAALMWLGLRTTTPKAAGVSFLQRTFRREPIFAARWGADNKTILYTASPAGVPSIRIIRPEYPEPQGFGPDSAALLAVSSGNEVALLLHPRRIGQLLFTGTLARMSIGGGAPREIADSVQEADWSPDGAQFAITRNAGDHDQLEYPIGKVLYQSPTGAYLSNPRIAPDGKRVALFLHPLRYDDRGFVAIVDAKGNLTKTDEFAGLEGLAWTADGRSLLFSAAQSSEYETRRWDPESGRVPELVLPNAGRLTIYDVRGGRWLVSRDDVTQLIVAKSPDSPGVQDISWLDGSIVPRISADGRMFAFADQGNLSGALYGAMVRASVNAPAVRLGDGNVRAISQDKRWILADVPTSPRQYRLYPTGAGAFRPLVWPKLSNITNADFLPGGQGLMVCGNEPGRARRCYRSGLDGGEVTPITPDSIVGWVRPDLGAVVASREGKWWVYPTNGGARHEIPGLTQEPTQQPIRWSPDGSVMWVFRPGTPGHRGVDRLDVTTGRRTPLFDIEELPGSATPAILFLSVADDGKSYVYYTTTYNSLLFSVEGVR